MQIWQSSSPRSSAWSNGQTLVNTTITLRKLDILPRVDAKMDESLMDGNYQGARFGARFEVRPIRFQGKTTATALLNQPRLFSQDCN
jgi:hypothetical protein